MAAANARPAASFKDALLPVGRRLIEAAMRERGLTVTALGLRLGISRKHVSNVLGGKAPLGEAMAESVAAALDLDAGELLDLRHDGVIPFANADLPPLRVARFGDPNEPIPDWAEP